MAHDVAKISHVDWELGMGESIPRTTPPGNRTDCEVTLAAAICCLPSKQKHNHSKAEMSNPQTNNLLRSLPLGALSIA